MPRLERRITDGQARSLPVPATGQVIYWCPSDSTFGVRVTATGDRAYVVQRRVYGKTVRRTLGKAGGAGAISADAARALQLDVSSELQRGQDRLAERRERRIAQQQDNLTLDAALRDYVKNKRRAKDGLPLKERTKADYLSMLNPIGTTKAGKPTLPGELLCLAAKPLRKITAADIRSLHRSLEPRGARQQTYAMQVLRAVLRHHGVQIEGNPLSPTTAGAQRVVLAASRGKPTPIPPERVGAWRKAARAVGTVSSDQLMVQLLTGMRPGEVAGIHVKDVDKAGGRITLHDTKNRTDHVVLLSTQAAEIVERNLKGKKQKDLVFGVADAGKTLRAINEAAGVDQKVTQHKLRHSFASIAQELVPIYALKKMLNHAAGSDITAAYVRVGEAQLRAAWQAVADAIEAAPVA